jgi:hypothetical protein
MSLLKPFGRANRLVAARLHTAARCRPATTRRAPFLLQSATSSQLLAASTLRLTSLGSRSFASTSDSSLPKLSPAASPSQLWTDARGLLAPSSTVAATRMLLNLSTYTVPRSLLHTSSSASRSRTGLMGQRHTALPYFSQSQRSMATDSGSGQGRAWVNPQAVPIGDSLKKYAIDLTQLARGTL